MGLGTAGAIAGPSLMRLAPRVLGSGPGKSFARKKLLVKGKRAVNPLHGGKLARGAKGAAYSGAAGLGIDAMFGGQPPPEDDGSQGTRPPTMLRSLNNPWSPSKGLMSDRDAKRMQSETFWGNMNKMMQMSAILNATGGDTKGFQDMMSLANKKVLSEMGDQREMDIYDSVYQEGNMPNTAIEAYERVIQSGGGSDRAAKIAGQYVKMRDVRVNDNSALTKLIQEVQALISNGDEAAAGARIHTALTFHEIPTDAFEDAIGNLLTGQALNDRIKEALKGMRSVNPG